MIDFEATRSLIRAIRPDITFHLASLVTGSRSLEMVGPIFQNNLVSTLNVLIAAAENSTGRIVQAGSFEEPDEAQSAPCPPYAAAKWSASAYARMFQELYQTPGSTWYGPIARVAFAGPSAQVEQRSTLDRLDLHR